MSGDGDGLIPPFFWCEMGFLVIHIGGFGSDIQVICEKSWVFVVY